MKTKPLTTEQREKLAQIYQAWESIPASTSPVDRPRAEEAVRRLYKSASLGPPTLHWVPSPLHAAQEALNAGKKESPLGVFLRAPVERTTTDALSGIKRHVGEAAHDIVHRELRAPLWRASSTRQWQNDPVHPIGPQLAQFTNFAADRLLDEIPIDDARKTYERTKSHDDYFVWSRMHGREVAGPAYGQSPYQNGYRLTSHQCLNTGQDIGTLAYFDFVRSVCRLVRQTQAIVPHIDLAQSAGWVLPHHDECWICDRPTVIRRDGRGRLHSSDGPALVFDSQSNFYFWHGVDVPERAICEPETITIETICRAPNKARRRALIDMMEPARFINDSGATLIHEDDSGRLWHAFLNTTYAGWDHWAAVEASQTKREESRFLRVPTHLETVPSALNWLCLS